MTEAVLVVSVLAALVGAFYCGVRLTKSKHDKAIADAVAEFQKRLTEANEKIAQRDVAFEQFKVRVKAAKSAAALNKLLQESLS